MTAADREISLDDGQPVYLFRFARGGAVWCYASIDRPIEHAGETYTPAAITRGPLALGSERGKASVSVTLPAPLPVATNWRPYPPSEPVNLTIFVRHVGEDDWLVDWIGRVAGASFAGSELTLTSEPTRTAARRQGNLRVWQRGCGLVLYSQGPGMCNVNPEAFPVAGGLTAADADSMTSPAFAGLQRPLTGGVVDWTDADGPRRLPIVGHTGPVIQLGAELEAGWLVTVTPPDPDPEPDPEPGPAPEPIEAMLTAADGLILTAPEFAAAPDLTGGTLQWQDIGGNPATRVIEAHADDTITMAPRPSPLVGNTVTATVPPIWRPATVESVSGVQVTAAGFADFPPGRLAGGYVEWERPDGLMEVRTINAHTGNTVDLYYGAAGLAPGMTLRAYPGCGLNWADCGYYNNRLNYGGDLWMPATSPFSGNPVW